MTRLTLTLVLSLVCATVTLGQQQYTVETIPNQRLIDDSRVSNPDSILSPGMVKEIDSLLIELENTTTVQVAVVAVTSIGDADIFDFSQELFNTWGIGHENNNGVLVLLVTDQRTIRIHTGTGIEPILTDVTCKHIQREYMVPYFKDGDYQSGIYYGMHRMYDILIDPSIAEEIVYTEEDHENVISDYAALMIFVVMFYGFPFLVVWGYKWNEGKFAGSKKAGKSPYKSMRLTQREFLVEFALFPFLILISYWVVPLEDAPGLAMLTLYIYFEVTLVHRLVRERRMLKEFVAQEKYYEATQYVGGSSWFWFFMAILFPIPYVLYFLFHLTRKSYYRNHSRNCKLCNARMKKLSERNDDQYLDEKQQFEEQISSVDYDIWICLSCNATRQWNYVKSSSKYEKCPKCQTLAFYTKSRRTVVSATYSAGGQGKETCECKFCHEVVVKPYSIARLVHTTSRSSSSGGGSSSSSSSWGGGSSSGGRKQ